MTKHNDGGPAYPSRVITMMNAREDGSFEPIYDDAPGMSVWDHYAGQALMGWLASGRTADQPVVAREAASYADAMIAEREKRMGRG